MDTSHEYAPDPAQGKVKAARTTLTLALVITLLGCVATPHPTPANEVSAALLAAFQKMQAQDVDGMVAAYSDEYSDSQGGYKAVLPNAFAGMVAMGVFTGWTFDMDACEVAVDGDIATAAPVHFTSPIGDSSYAYRLKREADGVWRIVNSEQI